MKFFPLLLAFLSLTTKIGTCQELTADFLSTHYGVKDYGTHPRNFDIAQTSNGLMYFGNTYGLLEFDGKNWNNYPLPNGASALVINTNIPNRIYIGSYNEFGFFDENLNYHSLLPSRKKEPSFGEIISIQVIGKNIYFITRTVTFNYDGNSVRLIDATDKDAKKILALAAKEKKSLKKLNELKYTTEEGRNIHIQLPIKAVVTDLNAINSFEILISTASNGVFLYNIQEKKSEHLSVKNGLQSNKIYKSYLDSNGNIWLATDNGISFLELNSPIRYLGKNVGIDGMGYAAELFNNEIYIGTSRGVYKRSKNNTIKEKFKLVSGFNGQVWSFFTTENELFFTSSKGVHQIDKNRANLLASDFNEEGNWKIATCEVKENTFLKGTFEGFQIYTKNKKGLNFSHKISGFKESSRVFTQDSKGVIWMCHGNKGLYKLSLSKDLKSFTSIEKVNGSIGLKDNEITNVTNIDQQIIISTAKGIYKVDKQTEQIIKYEKLNKLLGRSRYINKIIAIEDYIWIFSGNDLLLVKNDTLIEKPLKKINSTFVGSYEFIMALDTSLFLVGSQQGFISLNINKLVKKKSSINTLIRSITFEYLKDSAIIFNPENEYTFPFQYNSLLINYTATSYELNNNIKYQFSLSNNAKAEKKWSNWNTSSQAQLLDLKEDAYQFSVRSINIYGTISKTANLYFTIQAPWYRTAAMYVLYIGVSIGLIVLITRLLILKIKKKHLQFLQQERIKHKHDQLEKEKEIITLENAKLASEMIAKNNELSNLASSLTKKSSLLIQLKSEVRSIDLKEPIAVQELRFNALIKSIDKEINSKNDWANFQVHFDQLHNNFLHKLKTNHPKLNDSWLLFCAYIRMNKTNKEIAALMNISISAVEKRKSRLAGKLDLTKNEKFSDYLFSTEYQ